MKTTQQLIHGGDYNPEQWLNYPDVIDRDFELFQKARLTAVTVGIFSWAQYEPQEGSYQFDWMDRIFEQAQRNGTKIVLATPSGAKPNWMARKYPEIRRVDEAGMRQLQRGRHNHCYTSPIYREKVQALNTELARRYGRHPSLIAWHVSNEYGGYCHCCLCKQAFRQWLKAKYKTLDALNEAWWARFWSHTFADWEEIEAIDYTVDGLMLDWKRFATHQVCSFIRNEVQPLREHSPGIPVTTNFMRPFDDYDYWELAKELDFISWDSYPTWHTRNPDEDERRTALVHAVFHSMCRSMKGGRPFWVMENCPGQLTWRPNSPLKRPGVHRLQAVQALASGADAICYFQLRKSRGSNEQHFGAVIGHEGHENTRVFREVTEVGTLLEKLAPIADSRIPAEVAILWDWQSGWALKHTSSPQNEQKNYLQTIEDHYRPFWEMSIATDVINADAPLEKYKLLVVPMLYLLTEEQGRRLDAFVRNGGILVVTYQTGVVDGTALCHQGGPPGPLCETLGIWVEEFDALDANHRRLIAPLAEAWHGLSGVYEARHYLEMVHLQGAKALALYDDDFYAGSPALTVHAHGKGSAYYIASRNDERFLADFTRYLCKEAALKPTFLDPLPESVIAQGRETDATKFVFLMNFSNAPQQVLLPKETWFDAENSQELSDFLDFPAFGSRIIRSSKA